MTSVKPTTISGFALLEMICVLMLASFLMALGLMGVPPDDSPLIGASATLRSHLRYAQQMATADTGASFEVSFSANAYTLLRDGLAISWPGDETPTHVFPDGVSVEVSQSSSGIVHLLAFTSQGALAGGDHAVTLSLVNPGPTARISEISFPIVGTTGYIP